MRNTHWLLALGVCAVISAPAMAAAPAYVTAAIKDTGRPAADTAQDKDRKVEDVVVFSGVKPGSKVVDLLPGGGYYTRIFSKIVGPTGKVWSATDRFANDAFKALVADPAYAGNTVMIETPLPDLKLPQPADIVFTSRNYHDLHNGGGDPSPTNKAVFALLKKGGTYIVLDHRALAGVVSEPLHRMDPKVAIKEIEAVGFKFVKESDVLANPADPKNVPVFQPAVRGHTDQFILEFVKP